MSDVGEWSTMNECRIAFERLDEIWFERIFQQDGHCAVSFEVGSSDGLFLAGVSDDNFAETFPEFFERFGETENRHDFGGDGDVVAGFARDAVEPEVTANPTADNKPPAPPPPPP